MSPINNSENVQLELRVLTRRAKGRRVSLDPRDYQPLTPSSSSSSDVDTVSHQLSFSSYETPRSPSPSLPAEDQDGTPVGPSSVQATETASSSSSSKKKEDMSNTKMRTPLLRVLKCVRSVFAPSDKDFDDPYD
ncbi:hypothetical protein BKA57DRAFT_443027 [Linnemannia elongata]|nr:hypothetical protein BKA57DRAFT_443027 [Linnemannia elongata]